MTQREGNEKKNLVPLLLCEAIYIQLYLQRYPLPATQFLGCTIAIDKENLC